MKLNDPPAETLRPTPVDAAERLVDAIALPIGRWTREARLVFCNAPYTLWAGRPSEELLGRTLAQLYGEEAWSAAEGAFAAAFAGQGVSYERRLTHRGDPAPWARVQVFPDRDAQGRIDAVYTIAMDIDRDVTQREQLIEEQRRLIQFAERIPCPLTYVDRDYRLRFVNLAYQEAVCMPASALLGRTLLEVRGAAKWAQYKPYFDRALAGKQMQYTRLVTDLPQGPRWLRSSYVPDRDDAGKVQGVYSISVDVHDLAEAQQRLTRSAERDALTDALSRRTMMERLDSASAVCGTRPVALYFVDLDHFKALNDTHGHRAGDALLVALARALHKAVRQDDAVGRFGGDEFLVLAGVRDAQGAAALAEHLLAAVHECVARFKEAQGVSASIGYALAPQDATQPLRLLQLADEAMYEAKRAGKDRVQRCVQ